MRTDARNLPRTTAALLASTLCLGAVAVVGTGGIAEAAAKPTFKKANDGAKFTKYKWLTKDKRQVDFSIKSPALGGRTVKARVLLPRKWSMKSKRTWPIVYLFHGGHDNYTSWARNTSIEQVAARWDVIVVMPEASNGSYTNWFNYGKGGNPRWETFHTRELPQLLERNLRASRSRAAIGNSSGGQGAITYAARYPGAFKYAASLSGLLNLTAPGIPLMLSNVNSGNGQDPDAIWGRYPQDAENWKQHNPYDLAGALRGTKIFFSSGTSGKPGPGDPQVAPWDIGLLSEKLTGYSDGYFKARLDKLKIPYIAHLYGDGRHNWPAWRREFGFVWPRIMTTLHARKY
ncbi:MAG: alpha/beta hydrolase family protein [Streptosporangiaceae bacterium]